MGALTQKKFLTDDELELLFKFMKEIKGSRNYLLIMLALETGARQCEILAITKKDLELNSVTVIGAKKSNDRTLDLPGYLYKEIMSYCKDMDDDEKIFKISTRMFRKIWKKYSPARNKSLHSLRHTQGVKLYHNCKDIDLVVYQLGHKDIRNTHKYSSYVKSKTELKRARKGMWKNRMDKAA